MKNVDRFLTKRFLFSRLSVIKIEIKMRNERHRFLRGNPYRIFTMMEEYYKHETTYRLWCDYWGIYMTALYKSPWRTRNEIYSYALASVHKAHY
jgi:hypothetical protein